MRAGTTSMNHRILYCWLKIVIMASLVTISSKISCSTRWPVPMSLLKAISIINIYCAISLYCMYQVSIIIKCRTYNSRLPNFIIIRTYSRCRCRSNNMIIYWLYSLYIFNSLCCVNGLSWHLYVFSLICYYSTAANLIFYIFCEILPMLDSSMW